MSTDAESAERILANAYDRTPYAGQPFCLTHPGLLAAYGRLYGLNPSFPGGCRVLEMGCGDGGNIIPMACEFPGSEFMGIDLSSVQVGIGQRQIDALGLMNIRLDARSIMDVGPADGVFDYIIVHGVYSWVPDAVKEKILDICRDNLADQGIAYISYNVLPGWQFNKSMRDMLLYRTRQIQDPEERTRAALALVTSMLGAKEESQDVHDVQLRFFGITLQGFKDVSSYLLHEYLEADNDPFYFHQIAGAFKKKGLRYLCDAEQADFELDRLPPDAADEIERLSDNQIDIEQYLDFFNHTRFRHSLICRQGMDIDSDYRMERLEPLFAATGVSPVLESPQSIVADATAFKTMGGRSFTTQHDMARAVLRILSAIKPCTMDLPSLIRKVMDQTPPEAQGDAGHPSGAVGRAIYALFFNGVVELLAAPRRCVLETGERPLASALARRLAPSGRVTNLCHRTIVMNDAMAAYILRHLDGMRTRDDLTDIVSEGLDTGRLVLPMRAAGGEGISRQWVGRQVDAILRHLARCGLLLGESAPKL